jgi:5-methylcytosine-specific restriction endonuclease McrA
VNHLRDRHLPLNLGADKGDANKLSTGRAQVKYRCACLPRERCNRNATCPAAKKITWGLSDLRHRKYQAVRQKLRNKAPRHLNALLYAAFGGQCQYCGELADPPCIDRIIPGHLGGTYAASNVTLSCRVCNSSKHTSLPRVFPMSYADVGGHYVCTP